MQTFQRPFPARVAAGLGACLLCGVCAALATAGDLASLTSSDAAGGLRAALGKGVDTAVAHLGAPGGFLDNDKLRIPLPPALEKVERGLRMVGMSGEADELKVAMNHAAEAAVADSKPVLVSALKKMTITDAKQILTGGDDAATQYFRRTSGAVLHDRMRPIVAKATAQAKLGALYDRFAGKASELGLLSGDSADLDDFVTAKALDGLFSVIADEEHSIRQNPVAAGSALIKKVFGAL
jgi:Protein of unknown function (DUF4197)